MEALKPVKMGSVLGRDIDEKGMTLYNAIDPEHDQWWVVNFCEKCKKEFSTCHSFCHFCGSKIDLLKGGEKYHTENIAYRNRDLAALQLYPNSSIQLWEAKGDIIRELETYVVCSSLFPIKLVKIPEWYVMENSRVWLRFAFMFFNTLSVVLEDITDPNFEECQEVINCVRECITSPSKEVAKRTYNLAFSLNYLWTYNKDSTSYAKFAFSLGYVGAGGIEKDYSSSLKYSIGDIIKIGCGFARNKGKRISYIGLLDKAIELET